MRVCRTCGAVAPTENESCTHCEAAFENNTADVVGEEAGGAWAKVKGHFTCRSCGFKVALNHLDTDGAVLCGNCGVNQAFPVEKWAELVEHGHNTADLTGLNKPPSYSPLWNALGEVEWEEIIPMYLSIGFDKSTLSKSEGPLSGLEWEMDASPGHPVCGNCRVPLEVQPHEREITVRCPDCHKVDTYGLPKQASDLPGLVGVIAGEHCTNNPVVKIEESAGGAAVSISCPNCSGALSEPKLGEVVECPFCKTSCHVPARLQQRVMGEPAPSKPWWMLFKGPSPQRLAAEKHVAKVKQREEARRVLMAQQEEQSVRLQKKSTVNGYIVTAVLIAVAVGGILLFVLNGS